MSSDRLQKALSAAQEKFDTAEPMDAVFKFVFDGEGEIIVDGNQSPPQVMAESDLDADCTITASMEVFQEMLNGELDPTAAFMTGKISIDGNMGAAMKLAQALG